MAGVRPAGKRRLDPRNVVARLCTGGHAVPIKAQLATGAIIFALSAWVTVTSRQLRRQPPPAQRRGRADRPPRAGLCRPPLRVPALDQELHGADRRARDEQSPPAGRDSRADRDPRDRGAPARFARASAQRRWPRSGTTPATRSTVLRQSLSGVEDRLQTVAAERSALQERLGRTEQRLAGGEPAARRRAPGRGRPALARRPARGRGQASCAASARAPRSGSRTGCSAAPKRSSSCSGRPGSTSRR